MAAFSWRLEWDADKALVNLTKHGISFEQAASVLLDPLAMTLHDDEHSETEERWATLGLSKSGVLLVVVHTFDETGPDSATVRLISARRAAPSEMREYQGRNEMKAEYDFGKGERGKFYHPGASLRLPIYLEPEVLAFLAATAEKKGVGVDEIVNELLKRDIGIMQKAE